MVGSKLSASVWLDGNPKQDTTLLHNDITLFEHLTSLRNDWLPLKQIKTLFQASTDCFYMLKSRGKSHKRLAFAIPGERKKNLKTSHATNHLHLTDHCRALVEFPTKNCCDFCNSNSLDDPKSPEASDPLSRKGK